MCLGCEAGYKWCRLRRHFFRFKMSGINDDCVQNAEGMTSTKVRQHFIEPILSNGTRSCLKLSLRIYQ